MVTWANNATRIILNVLNGVMVVGGPGSVVDLVEIFMDAWNLDYMQGCVGLQVTTQPAEYDLGRVLDRP